MQNELDNEPSENRLAIHIIGVNEVGYESANETMTAERSLPWLQDTDEDGVWSSWNVTYRDVIISDENNFVVDVFNLTENDLGEENVFADLKGRLTDAASN